MIFWYVTSIQTPFYLLLSCLTFDEAKKLGKACKDAYNQGGWLRMDVRSYEQMGCLCQGPHFTQILGLMHNV